jgi:hypothetical protein
MGMFCIVSWHREAQDLYFWDGLAWGGTRAAQFFKTRAEAAAALDGVSEPTVGFLAPNVLDVVAYNKKFGKSVGPQLEVKVSTSFDPETGILTRTHRTVEW